MITCPRCLGFVAREPASVVCRLCGRWAPVTDATERQHVEQRVLDASLRPVSAECQPEYNVPRPLGWRMGTMRLPGEPTPKRGRA